jgi:hypothetical protein
MCGGQKGFKAAVRLDRLRQRTELPIAVMMVAGTSDPKSRFEEAVCE